MSILGQSTISSKASRNVSTVKSDNRTINLASQGNSVSPDLMFSNTKMSYVSPTLNTQQVTINKFSNADDKSLHYILLDNSNNLTNKSFKFSSDYVLLDDPGNTTRTYSITGGKSLVFFGAIVSGKMQLRLGSESTN